LEDWARQRDDPGDYEAAREGLEKMWPLQLCGGIYYVESEPVAYSLGEELAQGRSFVIHFEKAIKADQYKGIYQFINQAFASILPEKYDTINREQDLGDPGLRQAKEGYNPVGWVKKYRAGRKAISG
ncbi:phosphatidylglycerol lysyltransferase domain-containing protein, partial [Planctomycetota bacterium]